MWEMTMSLVTVSATNHEAIELKPEPGALPVRVSTESSAIDGMLQIINVHAFPHFVLYEHGTGRRIRCNLPDEHLKKVKDNLNERVVVEGMVRYREDGSAISVRDITDIRRVMPPEHEIEQLRGVIPGFTDGVPAGEFVRRLREDDGE